MEKDNETLNLIIDTDFGLDDVCAILYLFHEMYTGKKIVIHHIAVCQGQQLDTLNGVKQLYSMLKHCNIPITKFSGATGDGVSLSFGRHIRGCPVLYIRDPEDMKNHQVEILDLDESRGAHLFIEGDWYESVYNAQNHFCQEVKIPFEENFTRDLDLDIINTSSVDALLHLVNEKPNFFTLFAIGPLTNISDVLKRDEAWLTKLKGAYFMAGNFVCGGNTPNLVSEWNLFADPWSARYVFDNLEKYPLIKEAGSQFCRVLGLEVANIEVFPEHLQAIALEKGRRERNKKENSGQVPPNWPIISNIADVLDRVMSLHPSACSFDVVAAMALTRSDVVYEYHRLQFSVERQSPREGECVVIVADDKDTNYDSTEGDITLDGQIRYQRTITRSSTKGTDFENVTVGATVDIGLKIKDVLFHKVIEHTLSGDIIPESLELM